jgi:hypothetical protein
MSYFHLINENEEPKQNIYVDNINMEGDIENAKIKVQNGDIIDLSSLPDHGLPSYRLTSNGNGSVSWVAGTGTSGIEYDGGQPVQLGKLAKYNASDGSLLNETSFIDTDILLKDGSVAMDNNLNMNNQEIELVSGIKTLTIEPNPALDPNNINIQSDSVNFNSEFVNCNGQPLKEIEWRFTRQGSNYGNFGTENGVFFFGNFNNASVNTEIRGANNEKLVIDDSTPTPECRLENLNLDMTNNSIIDVFDIKTNNSVRTNIINANSGNAITLNASPGFNVEVNSNLNMNFNDITEVNNLETLNISSSGINITINDTLDGNGNNIIGVNNLSTDNLSSGTGTEIILQDDLNLNGNNIIGLETINGIQPSGGVFSFSGNNPVLDTDAVTEIDLLSIIGQSAGSKIIPIDSFTAMSLFSLKIGGSVTTSLNNATCVIRVLSNFTGSQVVFCNIPVNFDNSGTTPFELEIDFLIKYTGGVGTAEIITNGDFSFYNNTNVKKGSGINQSNGSTFATNISNELAIGYITPNSAVNTRVIDSLNVSIATITNWY